MPRRQVKLAYLMMLCAESALPMGGDVTLSMEPGGQWSLTAAPIASQWRMALWSVLRFGPGASGRPLDPRRCSSSRSTSGGRRWRARSTTSMTNKLRLCA
jgi:hypothetical protein